MIEYYNYIYKTIENNFCFKGLIYKTAHLRTNLSNKFEDIIGWNFIMKTENKCYSFYQGENPVRISSKPRVIECPKGINTIENYKIDIKQAINLFNSISDKLQYIDISLFKLIDETEAKWHFRTNSKLEIVIGANTGTIQEI